MIFLLAWRNLLRNKRRTSLTVALISLTLAVLMFADAYVQAMSGAMIRSATRLYPGDAQIHARQYLPERDAEQVIYDVTNRLEVLGGMDVVTHYSPRVMDFGMVSSAANNLPVQIVGIEPEMERNLSKIYEGLVQGEFLDQQEGGEPVLIGEPLAELLEVELGDRLVVSLNNYRLNDLEQRLFRVNGIFRVGAKMFDENLVFIPLSVAQSMLGAEGGVHEIAVNFIDTDMSADSTLPIWSLISDDQVTAQGWPELMPDLAALTATFDISMIIIFSILFVVAILGIINALFMSIFERTYEFGVLLAIGTRRRFLFMLIVVEALMLGLISCVIGVVVGYLVIAVIGDIGINYGGMEISGVALAEILRTETRPVHFTWYPISVFLLTVAGSLYPGFYAMRIVPAKALHKSL